MGSSLTIDLTPGDHEEQAPTLTQKNTYTSPVRTTAITETQLSPIYHEEPSPQVPLTTNGSQIDRTITHTTLLRTNQIIWFSWRNRQGKSLTLLELIPPELHAEALLDSKCIRMGNS